MDNIDNVNDIIHSLYNAFSASKDCKTEDIREVLLKVYKKIDNFHSPKNRETTLLINRLVRYIYTICYREKIHLSKEEEDLIRKLSDIGKSAGLNGRYQNCSKGAF